MPNLHKKAVAVLFLAVMIIVCVPTMLLTGSGFAKSLSARLVKMIAKVETQPTMTEKSANTEVSLVNLPKYPPPPHFNTRKNFYLDLADKIIQRVELRFGQNLQGRKGFIYLHGFTQRLLNKKFIDDVAKNNAIILDSHRRLHFTDTIIGDEKVVKWADAVIDFHAFAENQNIPFLYTLAPNKEPPHSKDFPYGITKNINPQLDNLLKQLAEKNVPVMDLREEVMKDNLDWYSQHYRTDHHWRIETAFWAHCKVIERLNEDYAFNLDPEGIHRDLTNYDRFDLPFLGSQGRRVGSFFAGMDDFSYYIPRFETQMNIFKIAWDDTVEKKSGTFMETVCVPRFVNNPYRYASNRYAFYFGGDSRLVQIANPKGAKRVLVIQNSYGLPFSAFLSLSVKQLDIIDLRHFTGTIREWVIQNQYDLIIALYDNAVLGDDNYIADKLYE